MGKRLSGDVDLFTDWQRRADFPAAVDAILHALGTASYAVTVVIRTDTFARLMLTAPHAPPDTEPGKLELSADWRAHQPVRPATGPVLHPDDAVADKMCALYGRAEARDFLDIDTALQSGRYTGERLLASPRRQAPAPTGLYSLTRSDHYLKLPTRSSRSTKSPPTTLP